MKNIRYIFILFLGFTCSHTISAQSCIGPQGTIDWLLYTDNPSSSLPYLYHEHNFPTSPNIVKRVNAMQTIPNYSNYFGGMMRGFIQAPETGDYVFNLTADDYAFFFLSSDTLRNNLDTIARIDGWTSSTEHYKYPEQTSDTINLVSGNYYYFEIHYKEGSGGDHAHGYWKRPSNINSPDWELIRGSFLYKDLCQPICPLAGTACDDGDPATTDDQQDGLCNCTGTPVSLPNCIGKRGSIRALYYDNIPGYNLDGLYANPNYPLSPSRSEVFSGKLQGPKNTDYELYGTRIQAWLSVPVTGTYTFNIISNIESRLQLSTTFDPADATEICFQDNSGWYFAHDYEASQTSAPITLQAGQYYYIELTHQENSGSDFYNVYWKTPFHDGDEWRYLDATYLYEYTCEEACIPAGTPCDDGDVTTFNDAYDSNCTCVGTACADEECTNSLDYVPYEDCAIKDEHSNYTDDSWLSCQPSNSPNPARGLSHWIEYDFGQVYLMDNSQIWNYNVSGATQLGFQTVAIDYSIDGVSWSELGVYDWSQASGTTSYSGFNMPDFSGIGARYVLFTALDNFDGSGCVGISEINFEVSECPSAGTPCDDNDPFTDNDMFDNLCGCAGISNIQNFCTDVTLTVNGNPVLSNNYDAIESVTSTGRVVNGTNVSYVAGEYIALQAGFAVEANANFVAEIIPCLVNATQTSSLEAAQEDNTGVWLKAEEGLDNSWVKLTFNMPVEGDVKMSIYDMEGNLKGNLADKTYPSGQSVRSIPLVDFDLENGLYLITVQTGGNLYKERFLLIE